MGSIVWSDADYLTAFSPPKSGRPGQILGRLSTITSEFWRAIAPSSQPTASDVREALDVLGMSPNTITCCYCGDKYSEWDHLRPMVENRLPTGFVTEIQNLVPSCGKCNQSKGSQHWKQWMLSSAKNSPASRKVADIDSRIEYLEKYEQWRIPTVIDFNTAAGHELWERYLTALKDVKKLLSSADGVAAEIRALVNRTLTTE